MGTQYLKHSDGAAIRRQERGSERALNRVFGIAVDGFCKERPVDVYQHCKNVLRQDVKV